MFASLAHSGKDLSIPVSIPVISSTVYSKCLQWVPPPTPFLTFQLAAMTLSSCAHPLCTCTVSLSREETPHRQTRNTWTLISFLWNCGFSPDITLWRVDTISSEGAHLFPGIVLAGCDSWRRLRRRRDFSSLMWHSCRNKNYQKLWSLNFPWKVSLKRGFVRMPPERTSFSGRWSQISSTCFFVKTLFETVENNKTLLDFILDLQQISVFTPNVAVACLTEVKTKKQTKL